MSKIGKLASARSSKGGLTAVGGIEGVGTERTKLTLQASSDERDSRGKSDKRRKDMEASSSVEMSHLKTAKIKDKVLVD